MSDTGFEQGTHSGDWGTNYQIQSGSHPGEYVAQPIQPSQKGEREQNTVQYGSWFRLIVDLKAETAEFTVLEDQRPTYGPLTIKVYRSDRGDFTVDVDMPSQTAHEAVAELDAIDPHAPDYDPEDAHADADQILLEVVDPEVADAYSRLIGRARWWAFA